MKAVLVAVNAKYIHSNLGIYCLYTYSINKGITEKELSWKEYTINQNINEIVENIYEEKPNFVGFSCYIWNIEFIEKISRELHKILPDCQIWLGGPEVSYDSREVLEKYKWIKGVFVGAGEESFYQVICRYKENGEKAEYRDIDGICVREQGEIIPANTIGNINMDDVVFPYQTIGNLENRIIYYETSRGCPYGCSYCLSSVDKKVKFRSLDQVYVELQYFLDQRVPQVKFVDRTFNCNPEHTMGIWKYIFEHDNGVTNFHFELSADILRKEEIDYVSQFRPGLVQFEIGVQTTNPKTIEAIHRKMNIEKLRNNVAAIHLQRNIHQHLDLIAGLPFEDIQSFRKSFNDVYEMKPDQLQLGFLKVLKGSPIYSQAEEYGIVYQSIPPYEVLYTKWISYDEIRRLKLVEEMVERFYNSMQFECTITYLVQQYDTPFDFYDTLGKYFKEKGHLGMQQSRMQNYEILYQFVCSELGDEELIKELMIYDLYARENLKKEPDFLQQRIETEAQKQWKRNFYQDNEQISKYLPEYQEYNWKQIMRMTHMEWFSFDITELLETGNLKKNKHIVVFDYKKRNPLDHQATAIILENAVK